RAGRLDARQMAFQTAIIKHHVDGGGEIQTVMGWNEDETMAPETHRLRQAAIFGTKDVERILRMLEREQGLGLRTQFHPDRSDGAGLEAIEDPLLMDRFDIAIALHALLARQALAARHVEGNARSRPPELAGAPA